MIVVPLGDGESYRLAELGVTLDADPWVVEVETFLFTSVPAQRGVAAGSRAVLVTADSGDVIAAAGYKPHPRFEAELLQALVVAIDRRGRGHAEPALRAVLSYLETAVGAERVMWLVHRANSACSRCLDGWWSRPEPTVTSWSSSCHDAAGVWIGCGVHVDEIQTIGVSN